MSKPSNIQEVISELKKKGWNVVKHPTKNKWNVYHGNPSCMGEIDESLYYTERQLHRFYKGSYQKPNQPKRMVKTLTKSKDRAATRDIIHHEKFDNIPTNKRVKTEDIWNHD